MRCVLHGRVDLGVDLSTCRRVLDLWRDWGGRLLDRRCPVAVRSCRCFFRSSYCFFCLDLSLGTPAFFIERERWLSVIDWFVEARLSVAQRVVASATCAHALRPLRY